MQYEYRGRYGTLWLIRGLMGVMVKGDTIEGDYVAQSIIDHAGATPEETWIRAMDFAALTVGEERQRRHTPIYVPQKLVWPGMHLKTPKQIIGEERMRRHRNEKAEWRALADGWRWPERSWVKRFREIVVQ